MNNSHLLCPICGEGTLEPHIGPNAVEYKGQHTEIDCRYSICDLCGSEQSGADQLRANKRAMVAFRKRVDGLLAGSQVRTLRRRLGLSQADAARVFGGGPVAFSKYEKDDVAQSEAMDKLLRLAAALPDAYDQLCFQSGVTPATGRSTWMQAKGWRI